MIHHWTAKAIWCVFKRGEPIPEHRKHKSPDASVKIIRERTGVWIHRKLSPADAATGFFGRKASRGRVGLQKWRIRVPYFLS